MPAYDDSRFSPPAPVVYARLSDADSGDAMDDVPMLIDTGADVTLLPRAFVDAVGLAPTRGEYDVLGFGGASLRSVAVQADLACFGKVSRGLYLLVDEPVGIVGRDILNEIVLVLNGPSLTWE
jgi:predicted aspartyl protease